MKQTRKDMLAKRGRVIAQPSPLTPAPPAPTRDVSRTRMIRCPCCGLQAPAEPDPYAHLRRNRPLPSISEGPYTPEASMVTWGGSNPKDMPGQRVRGAIEWSKPEPCAPEELQMLLSNMRGAIAMIEGISQEMEGGESEPRKRRSSQRSKGKG